MDTINELFEEISCERNDKRSKYLEDLIEEIFENLGYDMSKIEKQYHCNIYTSTEKHNALQFTYYITISSDLIKSELNLNIESGINNGTQLNEYSFDNPITPEVRFARVLKDVILDESMYRNNEFFKRKSQAILDRDKHLIFEYVRKNNYDNYVTGGHSKLKAKGLWTELYLDYVYEEIEVDVNLI